MRGRRTERAARRRALRRESGARSSCSSPTPATASPTTNLSPHLRSVLHDPRRRRGHRPRPQHLLRHRPRSRRPDRRREPGRTAGRRSRCCCRRGSRSRAPAAIARRARATRASATTSRPRSAAGGTRGRGRERRAPMRWRSAGTRRSTWRSSTAALIAADLAGWRGARGRRAADPAGADVACRPTTATWSGSDVSRRRAVLAPPFQLRALRAAVRAVSKECV